MLPGDQNQAVGDAQVVRKERETARAIRELYVEYVAAMFSVLKSGLLFDLNNETLHSACVRVSRVANQILALPDNDSTATFLSGGIYINRKLVSVGPHKYEQVEYITSFWSSLGVGALSICGETDKNCWLSLVEDFRGFVLGKIAYQQLIHSNHPTLKLIEPQEEEELTVESEPQTTMRAYTVCGIIIKRILGRVAEEKGLRLGELKRPMSEMISAAKNAPDILAALTLMKRHKQGLHNKLNNTAGLSILMGQRLGLPRRDLLNLGLAAALHDLGSLYYPSKQQNVGLSKEQARESIRRLTGLPGVENETRSVICSELHLIESGRREHEDASAKPPIPQTRIIAVARAFDCLTSWSEKQPGLLPDEALRVLLSEAGKRYDKRSVQLLVLALGIFPLGSVVVLSDGCLAVVAGVSSTGDASLPIVKVIRSPSGREVDGSLLDLGPVSYTHLTLPTKA